MTTIGDGTFAGCTGLTSVTIPNSVTTIGNGTFAGCTGLKLTLAGNTAPDFGYYWANDVPVVYYPAAWSAEDVQKLRDSYGGQIRPYSPYSYTPPAEVTVYNADRNVWLTGNGLLEGDLLHTPILMSGSDYNALIKLADQDDILQIYDISLKSGKAISGAAAHLTFALGAQYANQSFTLVHQKADGSLEYFHATADASGNVKFGPLYELSPFMLVKGTLAVITALGVPKTGDGGFPLWLVSLSLSGVYSFLYMMRRRRCKNK